MFAWNLFPVPDKNESVSSEPDTFCMSADEDESEEEVEETALQRMKKRVYTLSREVATVMRERDALLQRLSNIPPNASQLQTLPAPPPQIISPQPSSIPPPHFIAPFTYTPPAPLTASWPTLYMGAHGSLEAPGAALLSASASPTRLLPQPVAVPGVPAPLGLTPYLTRADLIAAGLTSPLRPAAGGRRRRAPASLPASRGGSPPRMRGGAAAGAAPRRAPQAAVRRSWGRPLVERSWEAPARAPLNQPLWVDVNSGSAGVVEREATKLRQRLVAAERGRSEAVATAAAERKAVELQLAVRTFQPVAGVIRRGALVNFAYVEH
jgi:hypothetical protein